MAPYNATTQPTQADRIKERQSKSGKTQCIATWRAKTRDGKRFSRSTTHGSRKAAEAWLKTMDRNAESSDWVASLVNKTTCKLAWPFSASKV